MGKTIEDYSDLVKEKHALNKTIAPVETNETDASRAYAVGEQLILSGILYDVIAAISEHDVITTTGSGANIAPAGPISSKIQTLTNKLDGEVETRAKVGAHNFLPVTAVTNTINGVTFTVNADKSVTVSTGSGGATADAVFPLCYNIKFKSGMIFKGCPSSGGVSKYFMAIEETSSPYTRYALDSGEGGEISASSDGNNVAYIKVVSGQILTTPITFYPMICLASDPSTDFVPYAKTNKELTEDTNAIEPMLNVLGAKNLLKNTASSYTSNGITFTVNSDGTVNVNGTATANAYIRVANINDETCVLNKGEYTFNGCPAGGSLSGYYAYVSDNTTSFNDIGDGVDFTISSDNTPLAVVIYVRNGTTVSNLVFKPMIRPASIEDNTYVPYAMTNKELTENYNIKTAVVSVPASYHGGSVANINFEKRNGVVRAYWAGGTPTFPEQGTEYEIGDIPEGFIPSQVQTGYGVDMNSFTRGMYLQLRTNGKIYIFGYNTGTGGTVNALVSLVYFA